MTLRQDMTLDEAIGYALLETEHIGGFARRGPAFRERLSEAGYAISRHESATEDPAVSHEAPPSASQANSGGGASESATEDEQAGPWKCRVCGGLGTHTVMGHDDIPDHSFRPPESATEPDWQKAHEEAGGDGHTGEETA